jgi:hypothetical protein
MDIKEYIQKELESGKSMEAIMNSISEAANDVQKQKKQKIAAAAKVLDGFNEFTKTYYPKLKLGDQGINSAEDLVNLFDSLDSLSISVKQIAPTCKKTVDEIISDFLREIC